MRLFRSKDKELHNRLCDIGALWQEYREWEHVEQEICIIKLCIICIICVQHQPIAIWVQVFKNGPSKICGRQPLKNLKQTISLQIF